VTTAILEPRPVAAPVSSGSGHEKRVGRRRRGRSTGIELGIATLYLSFVVVIPLAALLWRALGGGWSEFWRAVTSPEALSALEFTIVASAIVAVVNAFMGTLIAWVIVRDHFRGKRVLDTVIDLPFALPTIVAGLVLLALYGPESPIHLTLAYTQLGVVVALLFVTLPFVVRSVQPVLLELDRDMEQAAASLGASNFTIFRRVILPNLAPAILSGTALSFARALSEYGSTVLISGNLPFHTEVASVQIFNQIQNDNSAGAAAVSTMLLLAALVVLVAAGLLRRWVLRRG
jgi:sulfate/thiosulfate transport system permease protein